MSVNAYDLGDLVRASAVFLNSSSVAVDPAVLTAKVRKPDGVLVTYIYGTDVALVRDSLGNFHFDIDCALAGKYRYRFAGIGSGQAAGEQMFVVKPSALD